MVWASWLPALVLFTFLSAGYGAAIQNRIKFICWNATNFGLQRAHDPPTTRKIYTRFIYLFSLLSSDCAIPHTGGKVDLAQHTAVHWYSRTRAEHTQGERYRTGDTERPLFTPVICVLKWLANRKLGQELFAVIRSSFRCESGCARA